jgi:hypothetical protein
VGDQSGARRGQNVEIPSGMQRATARQVEAERERRAKIINSEGELQAAERLKEVLFPFRLTGIAIGLPVDLNRDNRVEVEPLPPFRFRLSCDPPSLIPSTAIAQVFELLIGTATVDLDLLGRSVRERQLKDVRHVAREHNYALDTGPGPAD